MKKMNNYMPNAQKQDMAKVNKINTAVILAAGVGSRMAPATVCTPKALLPLGDKPAINYLLEECAAADIWDIVIVVNPHQKKMFKQYLMGKVKVTEYTKSFGMKEWIEFRKQFHFRLVSQRKWRDGIGPMGALCAARRVIEGDDFAVLMGDIIFPDEGCGLIPVMQVREEHLKRAPMCSVHFNFLGISHSDRPQCYGVVHPFTEIEKDADDPFKDDYFFVDHIEEKPEKPNSDFVIAGRYIFNKQIFTDLRDLENTKNTRMNHFNDEYFLTSVLNDRSYKTIAVNAGENFYDIGNRWGFIEANAVLKEKE